MDGYTVRRLARLAGVSVRTLHHYDRIGLLKPRARTGAGYRLYGPEQSLRLQQILFFKEMDFPLTEIARNLADPEFNPARALLGHRKVLEERLGRLHRLLTTLDRTVAQYQGEIMLTDEELYQGFTPEKIRGMKREARELWGDEAVEKSEGKVAKLSRQEWADIGKEADAVNRELAALMERDPGDDAVQAVVARHHAWILHFWTPTAESYRSLGQMYAEHPEFRAHYGKYREGLADFLNRAIGRYCDHFPAG